jgi:iron complex transport system substrate-binding protein
MISKQSVHGYLWAIFFYLGSAAAAAEISVRDDTGAQVSLSQPARRVISLAPHVTELLYAAGAGQAVVGVVDYSDYPPAAQQLPRIGSAAAFDLEAIVALRPDLIVGWQGGNPVAQLDKLRQLGLPLFLSDPHELEDVASNLRRLGRLLGTEAVADAESADFMARLSSLRHGYQSKAPVSVFYQIWFQPLMTINGEHIISRVIELCGGRNVFASLPMLAPTVSLEAVLAKNPEAIIAGSAADQHPQWKQDWRRWPQLRAVQQDNLFYVNPDLLQRHTPRILQGASTLCGQLDQVRRQQQH